MTNRPKYSRAQTAIELAVFGAILIFVVGVIIRQALSASYLQNQSFRAMRQAMTMSYRYASGMLNPTGQDTASRQPASILLIEDRLTADSAKFGAIDRVPQISSASATYSKNLFLPVDARENFNLPVFDVFINGKHFPFTTAAFKSVELARPCRGLGAANCPAQCGNNGCGSTSFRFYPGQNAFEWEPHCVEKIATTTRDCRDCGVFVSPAWQCTAGCAGCTDCSPLSTQTWGQETREVIGCAKVYDIVYNNLISSKWCNHDGLPNPRTCDPVCPAGDVSRPGCNLSADQRFDLDRQGSAGPVPPAQRADFSWQWYMVMGFDLKYEDLRLPQFYGGGMFGPPPATTWVNRLMKGEGVSIENSDCQRNCRSPKHTSIDIDGDLKRENIMVDTKKVDPDTGIIKEFIVMDMQDGDLDMTHGPADPGLPPGLVKEYHNMYSFVREDTYLELREGRLYNPADGQFVRSAQKKDQIDIIERMIRLSNDTGRFCDSNGNPVPQTAPGPNAIWTAELPNPVEACGNCRTPQNMDKTCMDRTNKVIYVRSRVMDRRGRKWVTPTSSDDYVDFVVPGAQ